MLPLQVTEIFLLLYVIFLQTHLAVIQSICFQLLVNIMNDKHAIFKRDPAELIQYVHKRVVIRTVDGATHTGHVYTIDPVSFTFVLLTYENETTTTNDLRPKTQRAELVLGHAVRSIDIISDGIDHSAHMDLLFKSDSNMTLTEEELHKRRERLRSWLAENRFPVEIKDSQPDVISVGGDILLIQPPYYPENCLSTNEIILSRIQSLITQMPNA